MKNERTTHLAFKRGGFYSSGDSTTNIFDDPQFALRNLLSCIFYRKGKQAELLDLALHLLEYIKKHDSIATTDFWKGNDHTPKTIYSVTYTYSRFQTILMHLKQAGLVKGKKLYENMYLYSVQFLFKKLKTATL